MNPGLGKKTVLYFDNIKREIKLAVLSCLFRIIFQHSFLIDTRVSLISGGTWE